MIPSHDTDTDEYPALTSATEAQSSQRSSTAVQVELAARSHPGNVRPNNEDHYLVVRIYRALQTVLTNLPEGVVPKQTEEAGYGMVVADGMGGMAAGEVASQLAIRTLIHLIPATPDWVMKGGEQELERIVQRMAERYRRVDAVLREESLADPNLAGMGTTMTVAGSLGSELVLSHIGDSRAYLLRGGELHLLTRDHTLVQELVERGAVQPEQAATHLYRHVLTRALGSFGGKKEAEVRRLSLANHDQLLLCTDGLTDMVDPRSIGTILRGSASANDACQSLVNLALENGGKDNVTVVLARYRFGREP